MRHRPPRRTRAHLDDLIDGRPTTPDPLGELVAAVRAPAHPREIGGLDTALAAFAAIPAIDLNPTEENIPMLKSVAGRLLALKIMAVVAGTAAAGGVAYAAASGGLSPNDHSAVVAADESSSAPGSGTPSGTDSTGSSTATSTSPSATSTESGSKGTPSPSLVGLCHAWLAHPRDIAKVSTNPAFSVLIKAAGGGDAVKGYCTTLLASAHPTHPAHPTQAQDTKSKPALPSQVPSKNKPAHPTQARNTKSASASSTSPSPTGTTASS